MLQKYFNRVSIKNSFGNFFSKPNFWSLKNKHVQLLMKYVVSCVIPCVFEKKSLVMIIDAVSRKLLAIIASLVLTTDYAHGFKLSSCLTYDTNMEMHIMKAIS